MLKMAWPRLPGKARDTPNAPRSGGNVPTFPTFPQGGRERLSRNRSEGALVHKSATHGTGGSARRIAAGPSRLERWRHNRGFIM